MNFNHKLFFISVFLIFVIAGCARPQGYTAQQKREYVLRMKDDTLSKLYSEKPETKYIIETAPGYAVFSNIGTGLLILGSGNGFGVVIDKKTGNKTYMKMAQLGVGLGVGIKDFREVIVFHDGGELYDLIENGWDFGSEADAIAKTEKKGGAYSVAESAEPAIEIYQITEKGIILRASVTGSKYWRDDELN